MRRFRTLVDRVTPKFDFRLFLFPPCDLSPKTPTCVKIYLIMKSVCICGSRRFKSEVRKFAKKLEKAGVTVFIPYHHSGQEEWESLSEDYKKFVALGLTHDHFYKIKMAEESWPKEPKGIYPEKSRRSFGKNPRDWNPFGMSG